MTRHFRQLAFLACCVCCALAQSASGQLLEFERAPINYHSQPTNNPISRLQKQIERGAVELKYDEQFGYLPGLLDALEVPQSSQLLVFSKTSFQLRKISPHRPRAIYFNDESYIGFVQFGEVLEISTTDPNLGGVFYTLAQERTERPKFVRDKGQCLTCHASSRTKSVPGHLVRSVFADRGGLPVYGSGTYLSDHSSDFRKRFGGWYITGTHGDLRHMGNVQVASRTSGERIDREKGANVISLRERIDVSRYLQPTSDLPSILVLEHQTQMHNLITLASMETRAALHYNAEIAKALERSPDEWSESTRRRIESVAEKLVRYLFFAEEFALTSPVQGVSKFAEEFSKRGPRDSRGRSLYQLDLRQRILKYPCSWLIHSPSFDRLPAAVRDIIARRMGEVLSGEDQSTAFAHLSKSDRRAIREILVETKPALAKAWSQRDVGE